MTDGVFNFAGRARTILLCALLALATLVAFEPVRHNGFVGLDDPQYVTQVPRVVEGLTMEGIAWAFTSGDSAKWHPISWLSHMLDVELFGLNPAGHHATSILLHLVSVLMLFLVLQKMTGAAWPSAFVAALFALHPLRVESVAWIAERRDVLGAFFWMLTLAAYVGYVRRRGALRYMLVAAALAAGLMAKPMLVTLPFVLLLLDYWPLERRRDDGCPGAASAARLIGEKIPLVFLALLSCVITFVVKQQGGSVEAVPLDMRISNAAIAYLGYIAKTFWPAGLAVMYPYPLSAPPVWQPFVCALVLAGATAGAVYLGRRHRYLPVGWLWYLGTLVPVIGLVQVGYQASADRYTYLPSIGLYIVIAWGAVECLSRWRLKAVWVAVPAMVVLFALVLTTRAQVRHWKESVGLYEHAIEVTKDNYVMYTALAVELGDQGKRDRAIEYLREAVRVKPDFDHAHYNLAVYLQQKGRLDEAWHHYNRTLEIDPTHCKANYNLAGILASQGKLEESIRHFRRSVEAEPGFFRARFGLATAIRAGGDLEGAIVEFQGILESHPGEVTVYHELGRTFLALGRMEEAIRDFRRAIELAPDFADAHYFLAQLLESQGNRREALRHLRRYQSLKGGGSGP
jgi:tetratricopeptide (TPR) repeat protein